MAGNFALCFERDAGVLHRSAVTAADKLPTIVITAAKDDTVVGVMAASEHKCSVAPGNRYGPCAPVAVVAVTPTLNKTVNIFIPPCAGAEWYDIFFSTDAAPLWVGRIIEAQRIAGCAITAVGTVAAGGAAGTKQVETLNITAGASKAGAPTFSVTSALFSAVENIEAALAATDTTTALVATKVRAALAANANVAAHYTVGGTGAAITLTALLAAANDATLAIALVDDGDTGVTADASADTTAGVAGVKQVETATAVGTITKAGNATVTVTSALFEENEVISVAVALDDNAAAIGGKIRTALGANANVSANFTVSGADATAVLTAKAEAANDTTLNIAIDNGTCEGITTAASSADTTEGVAPVLQVETFTVLTAATKAGSLLITVTAAGMTGTPKAVTVPLTKLYNTTAKVAAAIRAALEADASISAFFTVGGTDAAITLTAKADAANDATMAIVLTNDGSTSVTVSSSADTTAGVAPSVNVRLVGTGAATTADPFKVSNAYALDEITAVDCLNKSKAHIYAELSATDLRSAPTLSIVPFVKNRLSANYGQLAKQDVTLLTAVGKTLFQMFTIDLYGAEALKIAVDTITGQGASANIYVELS
jgi:hypothetical protein